MSHTTVALAGLPISLHPSPFVSPTLPATTDSLPSTSTPTINIVQHTSYPPVYITKHQSAKVHQSDVPTGALPRVISGEIKPRMGRPFYIFSVFFCGGGGGTCFFRRQMILHRSFVTIQLQFEPNIPRFPSAIVATHPSA